MTFFTGKGDDGTSNLFGGTSNNRISKSAAIFECLGQLDELNATIGWCRIVAREGIVYESQTNTTLLQTVQDHLFTIQAEAAGAPKSVPEESVEKMSTLITDIESRLPPVTTFLILGGTEFSARLDIARAISRRAERRLIALHEAGEREISLNSRAYMNRLSSLLYALIRWENHVSAIIEQPPRYQDIQ